MRVIERLKSSWQGLALAVFIAVVAILSADWLGEFLFGLSKSPVSPILLAILIGIAIANSFRLPERVRPGLQLCSTTILQIGIMLLGIRLSLLSAGKFTLIALPFVVLVIALALFLVSKLSRRLGLSRQLGGLIAIGTSICGATAIVATAPLIRAKETEVSYAVGCITLFGVAAMLLYPMLAHAAFPESPALAGLFLGTSIHETAQVAGAGLMYQAQFDAPLALDSATVTKLVRNLCMIALIPLVGFLYGAERSLGSSLKASEYFRMIPWFVVGFALFSALRTLGDHGEAAFGLMSQETWSNIVATTRTSAEVCLLLAMAAVGLNTRLIDMKEIGLRPLGLGLFAALIVGLVSFAAISLFAQDLILHMS